ncbi:MAG TPA: phosphatidylserine decarboxylase [Woeseiaceae bacterium]|nr:phosphatidylserine decarboxylase [Woeseiaceae bacterium]
MIDRSKSFIAGEGVPVLVGLGTLAAALWYVGGYAYALLAAALVAAGFLVFRDPRREIATAPLGVVSPVDGRIVDAGPVEDGALDGRVHRIVIRVNPFGSYTARCPVEGKVMDLHGERDGGTAQRGGGGLWLRTDEGEDVVLRFRGHRFGLVPDAIVGYGSRVGQGQRCAYLRWTRFADLELPAAGRVTVSEGQEVMAGTDVLAHLPN